MMTCRQCNHQFCWLCLQDWSTHGSHFQCSKYKDGLLQNKPEFREGANKLLEDLDERFLYYLERFKNYESALKYESELKEKIEKLKKEISNSGIHNTNFIYEAIDQLKLCRSLIMNMFIVLAFHNIANEKKNELDYELGTLELITERLANVLEKELDENYIKDNNWVLKIKKITKASRKYIITILNST